MDKMQKLYNEIMDILGWAVDQKHITYDQSIILENAIAEAKEEIEAEE